MVEVHEIMAGGIQPIAQRAVEQNWPLPSKPPRQTLLDEFIGAVRFYGHIVKEKTISYGYFLFQTPNATQNFWAINTISPPF